MNRIFGCHVSVAGGLEKSLERGSKLGINAIQIHPSAPQRWNTKAFKEGFEDRFLALRGESGISAVFFHAIYLINLANPDDLKWQKSQDSLVFDLDLSARIHGDGVVVHVGSFKDQKDIDLGYQRVVEAINNVLRRSDDRSRLILEVAAGSGKVIGARMEELARIYDSVDPGLKARVGFGLDTQHMWASGYDWQNSLDEILNSIEKNFTFKKVWCIHLNDSKTELGSRVDRHENLGDGLIGMTALEQIVNHPKLLDIPFILETPDLKLEETAVNEVEKLRAVII